jgi:hypothetical protein
MQGKVNKYRTVSGSAKFVSNFLLAQTADKYVIRISLSINSVLVPTYHARFHLSYRYLFFVF